MAQELIEETMKDIGTFLGTFALAFTTALLNSKIEGAIEQVVRGVLPSKEEKSDEKSLEDKANDLKPIAAGVLLLSYKQGEGPDRMEHRYYDVAAWSVKSQDSVITNLTFRHRQLMALHNSMKKRHPKMGQTAFPQKKNVWKKRLYVLQ